MPSTPHNEPRPATATAESSRDNTMKQVLSRIVHVPAAPHPSALKMVPPANFAMVDAHVYRCGRPSKTNIPFLESLNLKSIVYLSDAVDLPCNIQFAEQHGVKYFHFRVKENKVFKRIYKPSILLLTIPAGGMQEPFQQIDQKVLAQSLVEVVDIRNHPMLIYSDRGKHRIGCLVGCLRKLQKWSMASIFDEYQRFSGSKIYIADQEFIEIFSAPVEYDSGYLPKWMKGF
ncbi:hypothetical protein CcCBS67573_g02380 [Chytriomyces confervae]|uniref:Tyrosine-protein phosphatase domain-containing protein n=1 Tax=Chytriomyces confervae TaxID=246404 RepID=A0A507FKX6_9FUNG|nr:hypothetical protein CcCBS67573_g02380 [Chytriomyces confervae]